MIYYAIRHILSNKFMLKPGKYGKAYPTHNHFQPWDKEIIQFFLSKRAASAALCRYLEGRWKNTFDEGLQPTFDITRNKEAYEVVVFRITPLKKGEQVDGILGQSVRRSKGTPKNRIHQSKQKQSPQPTLPFFD